MYHVLLTNRYLTSRVIPLIAVAAVALCVALIIIVVSVMTGFLDMVKSSGKTLIGDVVVSYPITGLPYYERLIERIDALPEAHAATPIVDGYGILKMPYPAGDRKQSEQVHVWGVEPASLGEVTRYTDTLYWRPPTAEERERLEEDEFRREVSGAAGEGALEKLLEQGKTFRDEQDRDAVIVLGMHVSVGNERQRDGTYRPIFGPIGYWWMPRFDVQLTVVPIATQGGLLEPETRAFHVVNEFVSGVYMIDDTRVMIPITHAQEMLHLDEAEIVDDEGEETGFVDPARATMILVRASDGIGAPVPPHHLEQHVRAEAEFGCRGDPRPRRTAVGDGRRAVLQASERPQAGGDVERPVGPRPSAMRDHGGEPPVEGRGRQQPAEERPFQVAVRVDQAGREHRAPQV